MLSGVFLQRLNRTLKESEARALEDQGGSGLRRGCEGDGGHERRETEEREQLTAEPAAGTFTISSEWSIDCPSSPTERESTQRRRRRREGKEAAGKTDRRKREIFIRRTFTCS